MLMPVIGGMIDKGWQVETVADVQLAQYKSFASTLMVMAEPDGSTCASFTATIQGAVWVRLQVMVTKAVSVNPAASLTT